MTQIVVIVLPLVAVVALAVLAKKRRVRLSGALLGPAILVFAAYMLWLAFMFDWGGGAAEGSGGTADGGNDGVTGVLVSGGEEGGDGRPARVVIELRYDARAGSLLLERPASGAAAQMSIRSSTWLTALGRRLERLARGTGDAPGVIVLADGSDEIPSPAWAAIQGVARSQGFVLADGLRAE